MKIGKLLKIYMDMNDISYRDMAKELNMSHATVSRIVEGKQIEIKHMLSLINWLF